MFASLLGPRFWIVGYTSLALGLWLPGDYRALAPLIPVVLALMLFFTSLRVRLDVLVEQVAGRRALGRLAALAAIKLVVLPLAVYALALGLAPRWALGVFLVAAMPTGTSSAALAGVYGGNVGLALVLTVATSLVAPLSVPLLLQLLGGTPDWAGAARQGRYILVLLLVPMALAQLAWRVAPAFVAARSALWQRLAMGVMSALIFVSVAPNQHVWKDYALAAMLVPMALTAAASALFVVTGRCSRLLLPAAEAIAFGCGCIYMNNGLSVAFATRFFPDDARMLLPSILMQVPMLGATVAFGSWMRAREPAPVAASA